MSLVRIFVRRLQPDYNARCAGTLQRIGYEHAAQLDRNMLPVDQPPAHLPKAPAETCRRTPPALCDIL